MAGQEVVEQRVCCNRIPVTRAAFYLAIGDCIFTFLAIVAVIVLLHIGFLRSPLTVLFYALFAASVGCFFVGIRRRKSSWLWFYLVVKIIQLFGVVVLAIFGVVSLGSAYGSGFLRRFFRDLRFAHDFDTPLIRWGEQDPEGFGWATLLFWLTFLSVGTFHAYAIVLAGKHLRRAKDFARAREACVVYSVTDTEVLKFAAPPPSYDEVVAPTVQ